MPDNCIVKNGFNTRTKALLYVLVYLTNIALYKCMTTKPNETQRKSYPAYGERLSSIENSELTGALKMSGKVDPNTEENNNDGTNDNAITISTRCTTDEPIKLGQFIPDTDDSKDENDNKGNAITQDDEGDQEQENEGSPEQSVEDGPDIENEGDPGEDDEDGVENDIDQENEEDEEQKEPLSQKASGSEEIVPVPKVYSTPIPRKMPDHYIDDI